MVEVDPYRGGPVRITGVRVRGVALSDDGTIDAEGDWVDEVSFVIKNVSKRPVAFVQIHLLTHKVGADEASGVFGAAAIGIGQAEYGVRPTAAGEYDESSTPIPPGGEAEARFPVDHRDQRKEFRRGRREVPQDISRLRVFVGTVFHAGDPDTMWYQHKRMIRKAPATDDFVLDPVQPAEPEVREEPLPLATQKSKRGRPESQPL